MNCFSCVNCCQEGSEYEPSNYYCGLGRKDHLQDNSEKCEDYEKADKPCEHCFYAMEIVGFESDDIGRKIIIMRCQECGRIMRSYEG